ncbi:MAG: HAD family hydrolase [Gemmatimonadaceae bacterium]
MTRRAVFLDLDGTVIEDTKYLSRAADVRLIAGVGEAIARLNAAGMPVVIVSNQSGIGRGYFTLEDFDRVQARVAELLAECGARVDAIYICPHAPDATPPCECRKPGALLFRRAAADHDLDLARSWYIGDRWRDVEPGLTLGGHVALVPADSTPADELQRARDADLEAHSLADVVGRVLAADN